MKLRFTLALLCCAAVVTAPRAQEVDEAKKGTIAYVKSLQTKNGGFLPAAPDPNSDKPPLPTLRATSSAVRTLKYLGAEVPNKDACQQFVAACFDKDSGGFSDQPGQAKPDVFTTAIGLMAVAELGMPAEPYHAAAVKYLADHVKTFDDVRIAVAGLERIQAKSPKAAEWLKLTEKYGKSSDASKGGAARNTASYAVTMLRLGAKLKQVEGIKNILIEDQRRSGGYGKAGAETADLESSYRVMRAFMMLKTLPDDPEGLRSFALKCRSNDDNGYSVEPGEPSSIAGTYFAVIIQYWLDQAEKK